MSPASDSELVCEHFSASSSFLDGDSQLTSFDLSKVADRRLNLSVRTNQP